MEFEWEIIYEGCGERTERAKVVSGWLVRHIYKDHTSMVFVEDRYYSWRIE